MSAFITRALLVIFMASAFVDVTYGEISGGTVVVGALSLVSLVYWLNVSPTIKKLKEKRNGNLH